MPLIDLTTNLRDLKFGKDRAAEDSSQQPFIQTKLPSINESLQSEVSLSAENVLEGVMAIVGTPLAAAGVGAVIGSAAGSAAIGAAIGAGVGLGLGIFHARESGTTIQLQLPVAGTGGTDFILRGGTLLPNKIEKDVKRLSKFFASPNGAQFILKQNLLSRIAVRTQSSDFFIFNDGIYTPLGTLAQAGGVAFGLHTNKQTHIIPSVADIIDTFKSKNDNLGLYESEAYERNSNSENWKENSRLFQLQNSIITTKPTKPITLGGIRNFKIGGIKLNPDPSILLKYGGGPGAPLGIGFTNIRFASERTFNLVSPNTLNSAEISSYSDINTDIVKQRSNPSIMDFRKLRKGSTITNNFEYTSNIEDRLNLGSPGKPKGDIYSRHDKINALPLYQSENVKPNDLSFPTTDIIPFRIGVINNDTPTLKTYIHFRAFLDNISDSYSAEWKKQNYIGRGEDLYTYGGFDRKVSLSWTVVAQSKKELIPMYKKLNYLASVVMPDYSPAGYMRGNMVTLTVGGYFNEQPGIITGFSFDMNDDSATWEIGIDENGSEDDTTSQLPHLIKVKGFNFIPIHTFTPELGIWEDSPFIAISAPSLTNK